MDKVHFFEHRTSFPLFDMNLCHSVKLTGVSWKKKEGENFHHFPLVVKSSCGETSHTLKRSELGTLRNAVQGGSFGAFRRCKNLISLNDVCECWWWIFLLTRTQTVTEKFSISETPRRIKTSWNWVLWNILRAVLCCDGSNEFWCFFVVFVNLQMSKVCGLDEKVRLSALWKFTKPWNNWSDRSCESFEYTCGRFSSVLSHRLFSASFPSADERYEMIHTMRYFSTIFLSWVDDKVEAVDDFFYREMKAGKKAVCFVRDILATETRIRKPSSVFIVSHSSGVRR